MENILAKKLMLKPGGDIAVVNSPKDYLNKLNIDPGQTIVSNKIKRGFGFIQYFAMDMKILAKALAELKKVINSGEIIWITYPKQSSGVKTDLNRDVCAEISQNNGFTPVAIVSIDETWSALRIKPITGVKIKKGAKAEISSTSQYIDINKKIVVPPDDLQKVLKNNKKSFEFFNSLSYSHRKEYVQWILDAKKEETRKQRIEKTNNMLLNSRKNPFS